MMEASLPPPPRESRPQPSIPSDDNLALNPTRAAPMKPPPKPSRDSGVYTERTSVVKRPRPVITVLGARPMSEVGFRDAPSSSTPSPVMESKPLSEAVTEPFGGRKATSRRTVDAFGVASQIRKRPVPAARTNVNRRSLPPRADDLPQRQRPASAHDLLMNFDAPPPLPSKAPVNEAPKPTPSPRPRKSPDDKQAFLSALNQRLGVAPPSVTASNDSLHTKEPEEQPAVAPFSVPKSKSFPQGIPVFPVLPQPHSGDTAEHRPAPAIKQKPFLLPKPGLKPKPGVKPKPTAAVKPVSLEPAPERPVEIIENERNKPGPMKATYRPTIIRAVKPSSFEPEPKPSHIKAASTFDVSKAFEDEVPPPNEAPKRRGPTIIRPKTMYGAMSMPNIAQACDEPPKKPPAPRPRSRVFVEKEAEESNRNMTNQALLAQLMTGSNKPPPPASVFREPEEKKAPPPRPKAPPPTRPSAPPAINKQKEPPKVIPDIDISNEDPVSDSEPTPPETVKLRTRSSPKPARPVSGPAPCRPMSQLKKSMPPGLPNRPGPGHPLFHYMLSGPHAIALFDYQALRQDEISFQAGDVISLEKSVGADWMIGSLGNERGLFPVNFVDVKEAPSLHEDSAKPAEPEKQPVSSALEGPRCRARFDYEGGEEGDLAFNAEDEIALIERPSEEWLKGQIKGQIGLFPASYVDIIEDLPPPVAAATEERPSNMATTVYDFVGEKGELSFAAGADITILGRVNDDWLFGKLYEAEGSFPAGFVDRIPENLPKHEEEKKREEPQMFFSSAVDPSLPHCLALHAYTSDTPGDLCFNEGQLIRLLGRMDADWLKGSVDGREGIFPLAFVEIVKDIPNEDLPPRPSSSLGTVTALHDFPGQESSDLAFGAGESIVVLRRINASWLYGKIGSREGEFPEDFVDTTPLS